MILLLSCLLCSCFRQAYHVSPFNGMTAPYRTIPLHSDSVKSATYINGQLFTGQGNQQGRDRKFAFGVDLSRSHNIGNFQAHYGVGAAVGNYHVSGADSNYSSYYYRGPVGKPGNYFYGGVGADAGFNVVAPFRGGEWQVVGVEGSVRREFGRYSDFRKDLPGTTGALIIRDRFFGTAGVYTEILATLSDGSIVGIKVGFGRALGSSYHYPYHVNYDDLDYYSFGLRFRYFNLNFHYTHNRVTTYLQLGSAGKAENISAGINYRLGGR